MSADNWEICPRCDVKRVAAIDAMQADLDQSYGNVPLDEFDAARAELAAARAAQTPASFREDWEIGLDGDEFYVIYKGACRECGLKHEFQHTDYLTVTT